MPKRAQVEPAEFPTKGQEDKRGRAGLNEARSLFASARDGACAIPKPDKGSSSSCFPSHLTAVSWATIRADDQID